LARLVAKKAEAGNSQMSWKTANVKTKKESEKKSLAIIEIRRDVK
jgi:hypothetical protein